MHLTGTEFNDKFLENAARDRFLRINKDVTLLQRQMLQLKADYLCLQYFTGDSSQSKDTHAREDINECKRQLLSYRAEELYLAMLRGPTTFIGADCIYKMALPYKIMNFGEETLHQVLNSGELIICKALMNQIGPCLIYGP